MAIPTVHVSALLTAQENEPVEGAVITAKLQGITVYNGYVLPANTEVTTDATGRADMQLWPNALGAVPSVYKFKVVNPLTGSTYSFTAVVPNNDVRLDQLIPVDAPPTGAVWSPGSVGTSATISIGNVVTLTADSPASVTNSGTAAAAVFNFGIPRGKDGKDGLNGTATVAVGSVTTLPPGSNATVTNTGTADRAVLSFGIPQGIPGTTVNNDGTGGLPTGGTDGQILVKVGPTDFSAQWKNVSFTGGGTGGGTAETYVAIYPWESGQTTTPSNLDATTQAAYSAAIQGATMGGKRLAGANSFINSMGTAQQLTVTRDGVTIFTARYAGAMPLFNDGINIGASLSTLQSISSIANADLDTGTWQAVLAGGSGFAATVTMTVGPAGSGKQLTMTADTATGQGFAPTFTLIVPRSVDGLA